MTRLHHLIEEVQLEADRRENSIEAEKGELTERYTRQICDLTRALEKSRKDATYYEMRCTESSDRHEVKNREIAELKELLSRTVNPNDQRVRELLKQIDDLVKRNDDYGREVTRLEDAVSGCRETIRRLQNEVEEERRLKDGFIEELRVERLQSYEQLQEIKHLNWLASRYGAK